MLEQYPEILLPNPNFKDIQCSLDNYHLLRWFEVDSQDAEYKDETGEILPKFLYNPEERIQDLSLSLYGHFTVEHNKIDITKKGREEGYIERCKSDDLIEPPKPKEHFEIKDNRRCWFINISDLLAIPTIKVERNDGKNKSVVNASPFIKHDPTRSNFWHFVIRWFIDDADLYQDDKTSKSQKTKIAQRIGSTNLAIIKHLAGDNVPEIRLLPRHDFCKA